ncbi:MAG: hypothetical protein OHK0039_45360 [Bacteroidia bacterium]
MNRLLLSCSLGWLLLVSCQRDPAAYQAAAADPELYMKTVKHLTDIIVHDIFSPPVASRIYAYPNIAAYEVLVQQHPDYRSLAGQATGLTPVPQADTTQTYCYPLAALQAFVTTSRSFVFSEEKLDAYEAQMQQHFRDIGVPPAVLTRSIDYGKAVAAHIVRWSEGDNYKQTRTFARYTVDNDQPGRWAPTPPDYMDAIEPHWNKIRPFVIDSATQFVPPVPPAFDMDTASTFYKDMMHVYKISKNLDEEQKAIASFWDCNPFVTHHQGHVMFATKKITPGGHWIGITTIACRQAKTDLMGTAEAFTRVSIALADAFISCWDEKYRSNVIRPETVINRYIDEEWLPLLQTPPFPEYTSGHSVISAAAALTLTDLFGEPFPFVDSTEVEYGLPPRSFDSFIDASSEAAISRLYGGIHYLPAIDNGVSQGKKVGNYVVAHLETRKRATAAQ